MQVPLEVRHVLQAQAGGTLKQKLESYKASRETEWRAQHRRYLDSLAVTSVGDNKLNAFHHVLACAKYGVPPKDDSVYDKRMMFLGSDHLFHVLSPLAKLVMMSIVDVAKFREVDDVVVKEVLSSDKYTNDVKGRLAEQYIIDTVARKELWDGTAKRKKNIGKALFKLVMHVEITSDRVEFLTMGVPAWLKTLDWSKSMLFDPDASNYPAVDLLVWDAVKKILYAIQVTIKKVGEHMKDTLVPKPGEGKTSKWEAMQEKWQNVLPKDGQIELVWLSDNVDCSEDYKKSQWVMTFADAKAEFPLLASLKKA